MSDSVCAVDSGGIFTDRVLRDESGTVTTTERPTMVTETGRKGESR